jgi:hypothetical protein
MNMLMPVQQNSFYYYNGANKRCAHMQDPEEVVEERRMQWEEVSIFVYSLMCGVV